MEADLVGPLLGFSGDLEDLDSSASRLEPTFGRLTETPAGVGYRFSILKTARVVLFVGP